MPYAFAIFENLKKIMFKKLLNKIFELFKQGMSKKILAKSLSATFFISIIPIPGTSTLLIGFTSVRYKWNLGLMVLFSYLLMPFQVLFFVPLMNLGQLISGKPPVSISPETIYQLFSGGWKNFFIEMGWFTFYAFIGWIVVSTVLFFFVYRFFLWLLHKSFKKSGTDENDING